FPHSRFLEVPGCYKLSVFMGANKEVIACQHLQKRCWLFITSRKWLGGCFCQREKEGSKNAEKKRRKKKMMMRDVS
ncbi:hypothetical protein Droror1_Dr00001643, partial [Drosera rotundifolia]